MSLKHSATIFSTFLCIYACNAAAPSDEEKVYRLPVTIKPSAYNITLRPYLLEGDAKRFTFDGEVYINVTVTVATNTLVLHSININYTLSEYWSTLSPNYIKPLQNLTANNVTQTITFNFNSTLDVGTIYTIHFKYAGSINDDMFGFFRTSYTDQHNVTKWLAATLFQRDGARLVFPSFDEPNFKATFEAAIIRHKSMKSFSNTRIIGIIRDGDYYIDVYNRTPPMSSYLLAFLVSDFGERFGGTFGVIARPEYYDQTEYSFTVGQKLLNEFDKYLNMSYYDQGVDKLHWAAIPGFGPTAMENWGLITGGEESLLYDNKTSTLRDKEQIANLIAHEQAHMWFGDIVTCDWWNYFWLNEGFANYLADYLLTKIEPDFQSAKQTVVYQLQTAMELDSTNRTKPMSDESFTEIIVYQKGNSIIRMFKYAMGEENFQRSLQEYLKTYKYQNVVPNNLLTIWEKHWPDTTRNQASLIFKSFTEQVGYPVVNVNVADDGKSMSIRQARFLLESNDGSDTSLLYTVPFTYTTSLENDFNATEPKFYLEASKETKTENFSQAADWVIANIQESGYYRVNYNIKNWHQIHRALLTSNWGGIHELNRAQIVDDLFHLSRADVIDYDLAFEILQYLKTEFSYLPWTAAFKGFTYLATRLGTDTKNFGIYLHQLIEKAYNQLGFDERSTDTVHDIYNREQVLSWSCKYGNDKCISEAKSRFALLHSSPVPVNIRSVVYCTAMREGNETDFNILFDKYRTATVPTEKFLIMNSLGCVREQTLIEKYFNIISSDDVTFGDKITALTSLYTENIENVSPVFDLVTKNFEKLAKSVGSYSEVATLISGIAKCFTDSSQEQKLKDFNLANKSKFVTSEGILEVADKEVFEGIEKEVAQNLAWSNKRLGTFKLYLEKCAKDVRSQHSYLQ